MAFTEFCCKSGGSNLNAGTRTGSSTEPGTAADLTYASGNWVQGTGVFTVASGDPVADGVAVGDFASVYANGSSETGFVGRVTARTTTTITVSTTAKMGTAPTDGTGDRTLKIGGAWAGPSGAVDFPLDLVVNTLTNSNTDRPRVNLKNDQTYSISAAMVPTGTGPWRVEGYTSSYGDGGRATIDGGTAGASFNLLNLNSTLVNISFKNLIFSNNGATGTSNLVTITNSGVRAYFIRCVAHDGRGAGFGASAGTVLTFIECEAYGCNQSNTANSGGFNNTGSDRCKLYRCISHDNAGSNALGFNNNDEGGVFEDCIADSNGSHGFRVTGSNFMRNCDSYNNGGDGYLNAAGANAQLMIENSNFVKNGGYGINLVAAATHFCMLRNNGFGAGTQANTSGQTNITSGTDLVEVEGSVTYANDNLPWVDAANGDFRINLAAAKGAGRGSFLQTAASYAGTVGYPDIGAVLHIDPTPALAPNMSGGLLQ